MMSGMPDPRQLIARSWMLLRTGRFITLSTVSRDGQAWASTVNYVPFPIDPASPSLRLVWYSMRAARHSRNIDAHPDVAGAIFRTDLGDASPLGLDGAQCTGHCCSVPADELSAVHAGYYELNFPDARVRQEWMLPEAQFRDEGPRRFYELRVTQWWLLDLDRWLLDKQDRRIEVSVADLIA